MEKIDYKHGKFNILTTSTEGLSYEDYKEYCEENGIEPHGTNSDEFYEWLRDETDLNFESDMANIQSCKQYNVPVIITGTLGLWDGRHEVKPVVCDNVKEAIEKCVDGCDDCDAWFDDGAIEVSGYHHDGTNTFIIRALSVKGKRKANADRGTEFAKHDMKRLPYLYAI